MESDSTLARAFIARQPWAYEAAYRLYGATLYAAAFGVLRDPQASEDCVHDVLVRLWERPNVFSIERGMLRAFLAVCVRNEALSRSRKERNRTRIAGSLVPSESLDDRGAAFADRESIRSALGALTAKQRQAIALAYFAHLTHEEIAQTLHEPVGTVKSRLSAALRRLRAVFAGEEAADVRCE